MVSFGFHRERCWRFAGTPGDRQVGTARAFRSARWWSIAPAFHDRPAWFLLVDATAPLQPDLPHYGFGYTVSFTGKHCTSRATRVPPPQISSFPTAPAWPPFCRFYRSTSHDSRRLRRNQRPPTPYGSRSEGPADSSASLNRLTCCWPAAWCLHLLKFSR